MSRTIVLAILDGWGIGKPDDGNPIFVAKPTHMEYLRTHYPAGALQASGIAVGLPWGEEGNSEVGHLTMGAGRVIYQYYPRISLDIRNGTFFKNPALMDAARHVQEKQSSLHLLGLLTESNIHASLEHIKALLQFAKQEKLEKVFLHLFADGKDSRPRSVLQLIEKVEKYIKETGVGTIASIAGRYYALDRGGHWNRTEETYKTLIGKGRTAENLATWVTDQYKDGLEDEFITPVLLGASPHPIQSGDALVFFDFREDSIRQLAGSFAGKEFDAFPREPLTDLFVATMTHYSDQISASVLYEPERIENPLGRIIADEGKTQLRIAETEKYAHVTYFFNCYHDEPLPNEYRILVPSKPVPRVDQSPEMMANEVGTRVIEAVEGGGFDFVIVNFANADLVAHTGNFEAAVKAVEAVDHEIGRIVEAVIKHDATLIITADHGHVERMRDPLTGALENRHAEALVPVYLVRNGWEREKSEGEARELEERATGILSDIAPTILELMELPKPPEMTGESLVRLLK